MQAFPYKTCEAPKGLRKDCHKMTDSLEKIEKKLAEHDDKFANQYEATKDLIRRVSELERKLSNLEKQRAA
jgi:phage shock protein A